MSPIATRATIVIGGILAALFALPAFAQPEAEWQEIRAEIQALRAEHAHIGEMQKRTETALQALEERLAASSPNGIMAPPAVAAAASSVNGSAASASAPSTSASNASATGTAAPRLRVNGDLRLRGQGDYGNPQADPRNSTQIRGRLGATYEVNDRLSLGARLVTGDADDPNSTDVTLSNFDDDLTVSLDLAYARLNFGDLSLYAGKIPQPFTRTDLVWDGDVNPQGASAVYKRALANGGAFRASGLAFVIDEQAAGPDSNMLGAQIGYDSPSLGNWKYDVSAAYYAYGIRSIAGADAGDFRSNLLDANGDYVSDFNLGDLIFGTTWTGLSERWPVRFVGDYVKNFGARTADDTGWGADFMIGRASKPGDWRLTYGYSRAETDSVFAAFSHDNTPLATNYRLHTLTLDYLPMAKTQISATWYHYAADRAASPFDDDWRERFRLYFLINF